MSIIPTNPSPTSRHSLTSSAEKKNSTEDNSIQRIQEILSKFDTQNLLSEILLSDSKRAEPVKKAYKTLLDKTEKASLKLLAHSRGIQTALNALNAELATEKKLPNINPEKNEKLDAFIKVGKNIDRDINLFGKKITALFSQKCHQMNDALILAESLNIPVTDVSELDLSKFQKELAAEACFKELSESEERLTKKLQVSKAKQNKTISISKLTSKTLTTSPKLDKLESPSINLESLRSTQCQNWLQAPTLPLDPRVKRWRTKILDHITQFEDRDRTGKIVCKYANCTPSELTKMKDYHDLPGTEKFIFNKIYSFPTKTGCGMMCSLRRKGCPPVWGPLYFGFSDNKIHHVFFEEKDSNHLLSEQNFFVGPSTDPEIVDVDCAENPEWEHIGTYNVVVSKYGVAKISYVERESSIEIFPIRTDLLPAIFEKHSKQ